MHKKLVNKSLMVYIINLAWNVICAFILAGCDELFSPQNRNIGNLYSMSIYLAHMISLYYVLLLLVNVKFKHWFLSQGGMAIISFLSMFFLDKSSKFEYIGERFAYFASVLVLNIVFLLIAEGMVLLTKMVFKRFSINKKVINGILSAVLCILLMFTFGLVFYLTRPTDYKYYRAPCNLWSDEEFLGIFDIRFASGDKSLEELGKELLEDSFNESTMPEKYEGIISEKDFRLINPARKLKKQGNLEDTNSNRNKVKYSIDKMSVKKHGENAIICYKLTVLLLDDEDNEIDRYSTEKIERMYLYKHDNDEWGCVLDWRP